LIIFTHFFFVLDEVEFVDLLIEIDCYGVYVIVGIFSLTISAFLAILKSARAKYQISLNYHPL